MTTKIPPAGYKSASLYAEGEDTFRRLEEDIASKVLLTKYMPFSFSVHRAVDPSLQRRMKNHLHRLGYDCKFQDHRSYQGASTAITISFLRREADVTE